MLFLSFNLLHFTHGSVMQMVEFYRVEPKTADVFFIAQLLLLLIFFVSSVFRSNLPDEILLVEEEVSTWADTVRGDD
jgi:hypothetical protein